MQKRKRENGREGKEKGEEEIGKQNERKRGKRAKEKEGK